MRLTVVVFNTCDAANAGGPVTYRRITVDLAPEQARALALHDRYDSYGTTFLELDAEDRVCGCPESAAIVYGQQCQRCGKSARSKEGRGTSDGA